MSYSTNQILAEAKAQEIDVPLIRVPAFMACVLNHQSLPAAAVVSYSTFSALYSSRPCDNTADR